MKYTLDSGKMEISMVLEDFGRKIIGMLDNFPIISLTGLEPRRIEKHKKSNKLNIN